MKNKYKTSKTIKDYNITYKGHNITVPKDSIVSNKTACGYDDNYYFWEDWHKTVKEITGYNNSILSHDLTYYGLNIPISYCIPYKQ